MRDAYPAQIGKLYGDLQISTPFGVLSPDEKLIFFKLSAQSPAYKPLPEGHLKWPRSYQSDREGLVTFDIEHNKLLFFRRDWGHPSWDAKSTTILNAPNVLIDGRTGAEKSIPNLPRFPGQHHSFSPDGKLFVTDTQLEPLGGSKGEWGVAVCDVRGGNWTWIDRFRGDQGATTWRKNHPHPAFSPDGNRVYYNVNSGKYTQLHVAERTEPLKMTPRGVKYAKRRLQRYLQDPGNRLLTRAAQKRPLECRILRVALKCVCCELNRCRPA